MVRHSALLCALCAHLVSGAQLSHGEAPSSQALNLRADPKKKEAAKAEPAKKEGAKKDAAPAKPLNLNKPMKLKAAEQGVAGKPVQHADGKTAASDWQNEYGNSAHALVASGAQHLRADPKKKDAAKPAKKEDGAAKKDAGKPLNLNKPMKLKAAEQGVTGKQVQHKDGETVASDWHSEYGHSLLAKGEPKKKEAAKKDAPKKDAAGGKPLNLNKPMKLKAAEQGVSGKQVEHKDGKTVASDWHSEYGHSLLAKADPKKKKAAKKEGAKKEGGDKKEDVKPLNLNKPMKLKAAEQGVAGKAVEHKDGKTAASDWQNEYGNSKGASLTQADPKKKEAAAPAKKEGGGGKKEDLMKKMPLKAAEQGFSGEKVQHKDGETKVDDWRNEYGHSAPPKAPKKSGSSRCSVFPVTFLIATAALVIRL